MTNALNVIGSRDILGRTVTIFNTTENPIFLAKHVAEGVGHSDVPAMLRNIDENEKLKIRTPPDLKSGGQLQPNTEYWFLTEEGLYEVLFLSRKPAAKEFKKGVKQMLHDLRTGKAQITRPLTPEQLIAEALVVAHKLLNEKDTVIAVQSAQIEADRPKVEFANQIGDCVDGLGVRELGLVFRQNGAGFGQKGLVERLLDDGYCYRLKNRHLRPYAEYTGEGGYFYIKAVAVETPTKTFETSQLKITGKGQQFFLAKYLPPSLLPAVTEQGVESSSRNNERTRKTLGFFPENGAE